MITPNLINLVQDHNRRLASATVKYSDPFGDITEYGPYHAHHMLIASKTDGASIRSGALLDSEQASEYDMSIIVGAKVGDPVEGGGAASTIRDFPIRGGEHSLDRYMINASSAALRIGIQSYNMAYTQNMVSQIESPYLYFSDEKPNIYRAEFKTFRPDLEDMIEMLSDVTTTNNGAGDRLTLSSVYSFNEAQRYLYNSDGFDILDQEYLGRVVLAATIPDEDGRITSQYNVIYFRDENHIPTKDEISKTLDLLSKKVREVVKAPIQRSGHYPIILDAENTGVFYHEVVGHSLEGDNLDNAHAFRGQLGERVAPGFLNLYDDPTIEKYNGVSLNGSYKYDDEGVEAQRVPLFESGVLKNFLHSRTSAGKEKVQSNGHSRSDYDSVPETRMGTVIASSSNPVPISELKQMLIERIKKKEKPYGIWVKGTNGGCTLPDNSLFDVAPSESFRIYPDGREERIRGIYLGGRIRQSLDNVAAMSDDYGIFNGMCGSGSGWVPNTEIAPSSFLESIEVCTLPESSYEVVIPDVY